MTLEKSSTVPWQWPSLRLLDNTSKTKSCTEPPETCPRPFSPHKYHPKHLQYTHAQPCIQTQPSSRPKQWLPPAGRCWIAQDSLPAVHVALFSPRDPGYKTMLQPHWPHTALAKKVWNTVLQHFSVSLPFLFRSLSPHCYPVSLSKNPLPSTFSRHRFQLFLPFWLKNPLKSGG